MGLLSRLNDIWEGVDYPFLIHQERELRFSDISVNAPIDLSAVKAGDVVALIGDFNPQSIHSLLMLIDLKVILVPLTNVTKSQHEYFFESALVDVIVEGSSVTRRAHSDSNESLEVLRKEGHAGLVLFSTGTTGRPKAILHNFSLFLKRFETPRPTLRTINFLLFDHIGGINTLLHTMFNKGVVIAPRERTVDSILEVCGDYSVEVLPTTPTFLRMMLMSGAVPSKIPESLKIITYGTERMDQPTLIELCELLPAVDFRQTFGLSELGIVRVKSKARDSLFMKIGGEGIETKVVNGVLQIRSESRMIGYLNAPSAFDKDGWYDTKDMVEDEEGYYRIVGRTGDVINVGGLKFMASEVERVALEFENVSLVKAYSKDNPITGQHCELSIQPRSGEDVDSKALKKYLKSQLPSHMVPRKVKIESVEVGHRFKRL